MTDLDLWLTTDTAAERAHEAEDRANSVLAHPECLAEDMPADVASVLSNAPKEHLQALSELLRPMFRDAKFKALADWFVGSGEAFEVADEWIAKQADY